MCGIEKHLKGILNKLQTNELEKTHLWGFFLMRLLRRLFSHISIRMQRSLKQHGKRGEIQEKLGFSVTRKGSIMIRL